MAEVASAFVSLMPSARGFGSTAQRQIAPQMTSVAKSTGSRFGKVFAYASMSPLKAIGAAAVGLFAVQKVKDFFSGAIDEARESQKVSALTAQVIKSTGGAAGISAKQVGDLANSISRLTGIDDEAVQGAENLLLTFTNLHDEAGRGNNIFTRATKTVTDMSVALGQSMKAGAIQVGKALNDPIKGVTALSRVGVSFTQKVKDQITALVDHGKTLKAQKIILGELRKEFGGAAAAAATSGDRFKTAFANLQESVGLALLPLLDRLLDKGTQVVNFLIDKVPPAWAAFRAAIEPVVSVISGFVTDHLEAFKAALSALGGSAISSIISLIGGSLVSVLVTLAGALVSPIALIGALVGAAIYAYTHFEGFRTAVNNLASDFQAKVLPVLVQFGQFLRAQVLPAIVGVATFLLTDFYPAMLRAWGVVAQKLRPAFEQLVQTIRADILPTVAQAAERFREWWPTIQRVIQVVADLYGHLIQFEAGVAGKVLPVLIRLAGFLFKNLVPAGLNSIETFARMAAAAVRFGQAVVDQIQAVARFVNGVRQKFGEAVQFVGTIPSKIKAALGDLSNILYAAGRQVIEGLARGIIDKARDAALAAAHAAQSVANAAKGALGIHSPSRVFHDIGGFTMQGLIDGIVEKTPAAVAAALGAATKVQSAVLDRLNSMRDNVKGVLDGLRSDFDSLRDSVASAFTGDLFSATSAGDFLSGLTTSRLNVAAISRAFHKLEKWGLKPEFLAQLFQSGNGALILDLASGTRRDAINAGIEFGAIQSLSNQLGGAVARDSIGPRIDRTNARLERIEKAIDRLPKSFGQEINKSVSHGQKKAS